MTIIVEMFGFTKDAALLPWTVQYFVLTGISIVGFILSLPGLVGRLPAWRSVSRRALLIALVFGYVAPVSLLAGLRAYLYSNTASWMDWEAYLMPFYPIGLGLFAWLCLRPTLHSLAERASPHTRIKCIYRALAYGGHDSRGAVIMAAILSGIGAFGVLAYTGMEIMEFVGEQALSKIWAMLRNTLNGMPLGDLLRMAGITGLCLTLYLLLASVVPWHEF